MKNEKSVRTKSRSHSHKKPRALVLFSGGLDSRLAIKILQEQLNNSKPLRGSYNKNNKFFKKDYHKNSKISQNEISHSNVEALYFELPFGIGCCNFKCGFNFAQTQGVKLNFIDCTKGENFKEYMEIIRNPKHGRGAGINPCIDCRIFILKKAKEFAKQHGFDIIATGEVLGERPMSQYKSAMDIIEKEAGLKGKVLRPLSAKILPKTTYEKKGLINGNKLFAIKGRCRKEQFALARKYKIKYPSPAGGCLLCDKNYAAKLKDLFSRKPIEDITMNDIEILRHGRYFVLKDDRIIVGRSHEENMQLQKLKAKYDMMFELANDVPGPTSILIGSQKNTNSKNPNGFSHDTNRNATGRFSFRKSSIIKAAMLTARYGDAKRDKAVVVYGTEKFDKKIIVKKMNDKAIEKMRI